MRALIYDCEIVACIPPRNPLDRVAGLRYCEGWEDHEGMGISVIAAYDYVDGIYRVFMQDNFDEFAELVQERDFIIGFNSISFDDNLCAAHGIEVETGFDLLCEARHASGQPRNFTPGKTRGGYKLNDLARANLGIEKSSDGESAPVLWQRGRTGAVIDYCLRDVAITRKLFEQSEAGKLCDPHSGNILPMRRPVVVYNELRARLKSNPSLF